MVKKAKLKISARLTRKKARRKAFSAKKHCRFCADKEKAATIDYKNAYLLRTFVTERGKILPSRISGNCCRHQRDLSHAIRQSRTMALVAYCAPKY